MLTIGVVCFSSNIIESRIVPDIKQLEYRELKNSCDFDPRTGRMMVSDGTQYQMICSPKNIYGATFDQIMIAVQPDQPICLELIEYAKQTLRRSYVPEEFQIIELILD